MASLFQHLDQRFQKDVLNKWAPVLNAAGGISDYNKRLSTAIILENTQRSCEGQVSALNESYESGAISSGPGTTQGNAFGNYTPGDYGSTDARMPSIVIPTARRIFPELLAHEVVGVQPMTGPVGFAFAFRARYGANGKGNAVAGVTEMGYNSMDSAHTGAAMAAPTGDAAMWAAFAGASAGPNGYGVNTFGPDGQGQGAGENPSEWWGIGTDFPMAQFDVSKGTVEAKTRKLGASWSLEMAEDIKAVQGANIETEMTNIISYELKAELDREILAECVKAAINGGSTSVWSPVSADGRNQMERISTLYTSMLDRANAISITTRRGPATFAIASPKVCAVIERMQHYTLINNGSPVVDTGVVGVAKVGTLRNGAMTLYRDTFASGNYILMGYKGPHPYDSGLIYCPYIPIELMKTMSPNTFAPRIGVRTRYGILNNLFGAQNYYHFMKIDDLTGSLLAGDGERVFMF
jgi:hypothetical protein